MAGCETPDRFSGILALLCLAATAVCPSCGDNAGPAGEERLDGGFPDAGSDGDADADADGGPDAGGDPGADPRVIDRFVVDEITETLPLDFIVAVDNSGDMDQVFFQVQFQLSNLAAEIASSGADYRFVLISDRGTNLAAEQLCMPEPMAGPDCGDSDRFWHIDRFVGSQDAFADILECRTGCEKGGYAGFLHPRALFQVVVVSSDESGMHFADFQSAMAAQGIEAFVLHAVTGLQKSDWCVLQVGHEYILGATQTGGTLAGICAMDWTGFQIQMDGTVQGPRYRYALTRLPMDGSLSVFAAGPDGMEVAQQGNWTYDAATRSVVFAQWKEPPLGYSVVVRYRTASGG